MKSLFLRLALVGVLVLSGSVLQGAAARDTGGEAASALDEAREANDSAPDDIRIRDKLQRLLGEEIKAARAEGDTELVYQLLAELIARLDESVEQAPTFKQFRLLRYQAHSARYDIELRLKDDKTTALESLRIAEWDIRTLTREHPDTTRYFEELALTQIRLGWLVRQVEGVPEAAVHYDEAVSLAREVLDRTPQSSRASHALAYGLWFQAWKTGFDVGTYEAFEAALPIYAEAVERFDTALGHSINKGVMQDRALIWHEYGGAHRELGDDHQAYNTLRVSFQKLKQASDAFPDDAELYRKMYQYAYQMVTFTDDADERIILLERARKLVAEAEAKGVLHAEDQSFPAWIERDIAHNRKMAAATSSEEMDAIMQAYLATYEGSIDQISASTQIKNPAE